MPAQTLSAAPRREGGGAAARLGIPVALLLVAATGWWYSGRMAGDMTGGSMSMPMESTMSLAAFVLAWVAMMAAMMLPAILPVVKLYALAATQGRAAPLPFFAAGYLLVWSLLAVPAYLAWRALEMPLADQELWTGRLAGATLLAAAAWQLTPLKSACLRHCRSPMGFFLRSGRRVGRASGALRMGATHGAFCVGCCWTLFAVLVAVGTMSLAWMVALTVLIVLEKQALHGRAVLAGGTAVLAILGAVLVAAPETLFDLT